MKKLLLILLCAPIMSFGQNVYIPDIYFKNYLVYNTAINTNGDGEIQVSEASAFTGTINCSNLSISDLTGIEAFTALTDLNCGNNQLTSLDVSNNTALTALYCWGNQLTSLDVSNNTALTSLDCTNNPLECLNVKNGNNALFTYLVILANPSLTCIEVDDVKYSTTNWNNIDPQTSFSNDCGNDCSSSTVGINELTTSKNLIQIVDMMGRETPFKPNTPLLYIYDDGTVERKIIIE